MKTLFSNETLLIQAIKKNTFFQNTIVLTDSKHNLLDCTIIDKKITCKLYEIENNSFHNEDNQNFLADNYKQVGFKTIDCTNFYNQLNFKDSL